ncbi:SGNH/GDSL hydrolase family protein [Clostridium hydrogenum]|uniref:SGNH/GDSL hydrolase family protein n=1 Tax=Clostridium hydrogenum TaxID=2855764 RepID=UPI001F3C34A2|nr:SGNH/GDSL hydrolase family protein [Clostridium hydrogenum]
MKKIIVHGVTIIAIAVIAVSIWGFITSISLTTGKNDKYVAKEDNNAVEVKNSIKYDKNSYNILAMGDSLAKGTGDESNKGFAGNFADYLQTKTSKSVRLDNLAINGDTSDGLLQVVKSSEAAKLIKNSNIILISIGGNEITKFKNADVSSEEGQFKATQDSYLNNLKNIFNTIRGQNKNCKIVCIGLYNPFGENINSDKIKLIDDWNSGTQDVIADDSNAVFIPTYDLFRYNAQSYLTIDNFHPNSAGYIAIAKRIEEAVKQ